MQIRCRRRASDASGYRFPNRGTKASLETASAVAGWLASQQSAHIAFGACTLHSLWNQELCRRRLRLVLGTAASQ